MNEQVINKYNIPVPRYTSYPPANYFKELNDTEYLSAVDASNDASRNHVSFYLHIPYCNHLCHYCGCNSYAMAKEQQVDKYVEALHREIDIVAAHIDKANRRISQIHYGGGSPTSLPIHYIKELNEHLLSLMPTIEKPEIAIECHPGYLTESDWKALCECGFTRYSLGIQDFNNDVLKAVNRLPSLLPVPEILSILRAHQATINMDFLFGLPLQTPESFEQTMQKAIEMQPDRLVTFSYGHVPWVHTRQLILEKIGLPTADVKQEMMTRAINVLHSAGYRSIGMDHFVRPNDELSVALDSKQLHRNFQGYCTLRTTGQVYAFGVTGISQLGNAYAQNGRNITKYIDSILNDNKLDIERGYILSSQEQVVREVIETMMCNNEIEWNKLSKELNLSVESIQSNLNYDVAKLQEMANDGLITMTEQGISMTTSGSPFVRNVVALLDPLMKNNNKQYSKPI